jgi:hypothetical protein
MNALAGVRRWGFGPMSVEGLNSLRYVVKDQGRIHPGSFTIKRSITANRPHMCRALNAYLGDDVRSGLALRLGLHADFDEGDVRL